MSFLQHPLDHRPVIIGAGLAGLMAALDAAPQPVLLITAAPLGEGAASAWAQGGLAAAIGADDSIENHIADTLIAGDGICDARAVRDILGEAPGLIDKLSRLGARFDRSATGGIALGLEAGHSARRIVHAAGDASGREILRAVIAAAQATPSITILENVAARKLIVRDGKIAGVLAMRDNGEAVMIRTSRVVIATGGAGGMYAHTTNPAGAIGHGLMLAGEIGAELADLEFIQFHPTALATNADPMKLISEAVRGENAVLIDEAGNRFMAGMGRAELDPRDIVARRVWRHICAGHQVFLDARHCLGARFATKFPAITELCRAEGIDPVNEPIPVRPAAHYTMGGIATDLDGRTNIAGLWACGEAASTGLHGANRLASNSLLEAAVMGARVARDLAGTTATRAAPLATIDNPAKPDASAVRAIMSRHGFVLRDEAGLRTAISALLSLAQESANTAGPARLAAAMCVAMHARQESRGGHAREDFLEKSPAFAKRSVVTLEAALRDARAIAAGHARIQTGRAR
jgi:L-aspartate oxidase